MTRSSRLIPRNAPAAIGMIVNYQDMGTIREDGNFAYLAQMHNRRRERTDTHGMDTDDFVFLIKYQYNKVFSSHIGKIGRSLEPKRVS